MAIIRSSSAELIAFFETGDIPTADNFNDFIRSTAVYDGSLPIISGSSVSTGSFGHLVVTSDSVGSHLIPNTTLTYDLGSGSKLWNIAYINQLSGSGTTGEANLTASLSIIPGADDTYNLGTASAEWKDLFVDGTAYIDTISNSPYVTINTASILYLTSSLIPGNNNIQDIGSSTKRWHDLHVSGTAHFYHSASIASASIDHINSDLHPTLDNTVSLGTAARSWKDLHVQGTATIGTLSLSNISSDHITASGVISGSSTSSLIIGGAATIGSLSATSASIDHHITASCNISSSGTITGDKLVINSPSGIAATITTASFNYISSSLIPGNDDIQDLGSSTKEWKDLYIDGVAYIDSASITNTDITKVNSDLTPTVTNLKDLGTSALQWKDLYVDGKAYIDEISGSGTTGDSALTASVHIVPGVDDTYSLGSTGLEWKDLFIDGTANLDNAVIGTLTLTSLSSNALPTTTNAYSLGTGSKRYTEVYTTSQSLSVSASLSAIKFENLPTTEARARLIGTGSLWLGGLSGSSRSNLLCVFTG